MDFVEKNAKSIAAAVGVLLVVGLIWAIASGYKGSQEKKAQEKFAALEKEYAVYKEKRLADVRKEMDKKNPPAKDAKKETPQPEIAFNNDQFKTQLSQFIAENSKTASAGMASLYLSEVLISEGKTEEALKAVESANVDNSSLVGILVQKKKADLLSNLGKCEESLPVWEKLSKESKAHFMVYDIKILQALCYQKTQNVQKAEEILTSIANDKSEAAVEYTQRAQQLLKFIKFNKPATGS